MNTRISYRYADKRNCKQFTMVVVQGTITWEQIAPYLALQHSFIPGLLGLEDLQLRFVLPGADHPWHQIALEDIRPTEAEPTVAVSAEDLAWRFAHTTWDAGQQRSSEVSNTTPESKTPARTSAEILRSASHTYAKDKVSSQLEAAGTPARPRSVRIK